jgi:hypothetical protein
MNDEIVFEEVVDLYRIVRIKILRRTPNVDFDAVPMALLPRIDAIDRVMHQPGAVSPGPVGDVARPWYMHPCQADNLMVLRGTRTVDIYTPEHGQVETFTVGPNVVVHNGEVKYEGPAMLVWPRKVFHRITSDGKEGSSSVNFAVHYEGFNLRSNFNIYDLDTKTGTFHVIREGHLDQPGS